MPAAVAMGAHISPFLLLDYAGPHRFAPTTQRRGVGPHPHRGRPNASYMVPYTVRAMADVTGSELSGLCAQIAANTVLAYGSWD